MSAKRAEAVDVVAERPSDARPGGRLRDLTPLAFSAPSLSLLQAMHVLQAKHSEGAGDAEQAPIWRNRAREAPARPKEWGVRRGAVVKPVEH